MPIYKEQRYPDVSSIEDVAERIGKLKSELEIVNFDMQELMRKKAFLEQDIKFEEERLASENGG